LLFFNHNQLSECIPIADCYTYSQNLQFTTVRIDVQTMKHLVAVVVGSNMEGNTVLKNT